MIPEEHLQELRSICPEAKTTSEGGVDYVLLPALKMPDGCSPDPVDCLLCLGPRDGYPNRLLFAQVVNARGARNWNGQNIRVVERNWFAYSWRVPEGLRPMETLIGHLQALR
jgi:hypothetical protein